MAGTVRVRCDSGTLSINTAEQAAVVQGTNEGGVGWEEQDELVWQAMKSVFLADLEEQDEWEEQDELEWQAMKSV
eukprot:SAG11_NODE_7721_length_1104_cov_8.857711_3_plen_74_part_01